jgi:hypothetical protein
MESDLEEANILCSFGPFKIPTPSWTNMLRNAGNELANGYILHVRCPRLRIGAIKTYTGIPDRIVG